MKRNVKIVLYFLANGNLTAEAEAEAKAIERTSEDDVTVRFRNGSVPVTGKLEKCDYVAGAPIPAEYLQTFPKIGAAGSVDDSNVGKSNAPETDAPQTGAVSSTGAEVDPLAAEVGSVGGWGAPAAPKTT